MKIKQITFTLCLIALVLITFACQGQDPRYNKWNRYVDNNDGYTIFVPQDWGVENEMIPAMRGTRFYPITKYTGDLSGFVYFSVFVMDSPEKLSSEDATKYVNKIIEGTWQNLNLEMTKGTFKGRVAYNFEISGNPLYTQYQLRGRIKVFRTSGKAFLMMAGATEESFKSLAEEYELIYNGFKLPEAQ